MNYHIRNAEPNDIDEIIRLCAEHAAFEQTEFSPAGKAEKLAKFLFSDTPRLFCLLAESGDEEVLGYATFMQEFSTWDADFYLHMDCLFLRSHARNFGIGEQLMKEIARRTKELNCQQLQWQTPTFNEKGSKFYDRIGATSKEKLRLYVDGKTIGKLAE